jgi:hypothetical protein
MTHVFERDADGRTIIAPINFNTTAHFHFILDTGASCTTIDRNALLLEGFELGEPNKKGYVETSKGILETDIYLFESLSAFGLTRRNVEVQTYDFLKQGLSANYRGVLGLSFFKGTKFTVNMVENTIEVESLTNT